MYKYLLLAFAALLTACAPEGQEKALISGQVQGAENILVKLYQEDEFVDSTRTDSTGFFAFAISPKEANYYNLDLEGDKVALFLDPAHPVSFTADRTDLQTTLQFEGKTASLQSFLNNKYQYQSDAGLMDLKIYKMQPEYALVHLDSVEPILLAQLNEATSQSAVQYEKFSAHEEADIKYSIAIIKQNFPSYHKYYNKVESVDLPENFNNYQEELSLNENILVGNSSYENYIMNAMRDDFSAKYDADTTILENQTMVDLNMEWIKSNITAPELKERISFKVIEEQLKYYGLTDIEPYLEEFKQNAVKADNVARVDELAEKWRKIAPGTKSANFTFLDYAGDSTSISTYKGKYIYVDAWATWCGPCKREIPSLEALQEEFKAEDVVFLSVSLDNEKEDWLAYVEEHELGGVQAFADGAFRSKFAEHFFIRAIPRFMLIDPAGKIVNPSMTRPSNPETKETLSKLLAKEA